MSFQNRVYAVVKEIPRGRVATYGQIAALVGKPGAAQAVGRAMHQMDQISPQQMKSYPWWRVINSKGYISTTCREHTAVVQRDLLIRDGVEVSQKAHLYYIDMKVFLWNPRIQDF